MKYLLITVLVVSFVGIGTLGFAGMSHSNSQNYDNGCIWAISQGTDCPKQGNSIDYLASHFNAFKNFSSAAFGTLATTLLLLSLFIVGTTFSLLSGNLVSPKLNLSHHWLKRLDSLRLLSQYRLIHWLSLHENSPARV